MIVAEAIFSINIISIFNKFHFKILGKQYDNTTSAGKKAKLNNLNTKACLIYVELLLIN